MNIPFQAVLLVSALLLTACATPQSRIKRNAELFESFSPEVQVAVQEGRIDLGFTPDMVFIALGTPDREYTRRSGDGVLTVWSYTDHYAHTRRQLVDGRFRVRDPRSGHVHSVRDSVWVDVPTYYEYDRLRIEFVEDAVVAIEEVNQ